MIIIYRYFYPLNMDGFYAKSLFREHASKYNAKIFALK